MATAAQKRKQLAEAKANTIAPDYIKEDSNRGSENVTANDLVIPRIDVIQALSPQRNKSKDAYIKGAEEGIFFNSVTNKLYGEGIEFVPVHFVIEYIIWRDRDRGGGFRGAFTTLREAQTALPGLEDADDCEIMETAQHYILAVGDDGDLEEAILSMSRSKMGTSRKLNSLARIAGGDRFSRKYKLTSTSVDGAKGEYRSYNVAPIDGFVNEEEYKAGETMYSNITAGNRTIDREADVE